MTVLVTGARGFIGRHLVEALGRLPNTEVIECDVGSREADLERGLRTADVIFHLAGVNRPKNDSEFQTGNADFTTQLCAKLALLRDWQSLPASPVLVFSSSIQAALENPYGLSKRRAEQAIAEWAGRQGGKAYIFRLKNVFGKWCRPNYNSVTATFCYNIAHDLPITISDPDRELELVYIDDVIEAFLGVLGECKAGGGRREAGTSGRAVACEFREVGRSFKVTLGELAARIRSFRESRCSLVLPDFSDPFNRCLYATYLSYLDGPDFAYALEQKTDPRGTLAEFVKSPSAGQIFVSRTRPGVTRGNHYHHTKTEKFLVLEGEAIIRFRRVAGEGSGKGQGLGEVGSRESGKHQAVNAEQSLTATSSAPACSLRVPAGTDLIEHRVSGRDFKVLDIPPGYTHSIENVGPGELVTLFWASEVFDPTKPDTYAMSVLGEAGSGKGLEVNG
ncbi:MAG: NAD-dependent epimerase/dehydratase family protein [Verrucomicrobia bacterium]|jgi:UDP-2-acetamido-2,6-beta-L-arabino-hexul-4-ose reductase|nr:NAD-dependent epimerase/dehydratase family protein [Verrucomicrobiota bacterium]